MALKISLLFLIAFFTILSLCDSRPQFGDLDEDDEDNDLGADGEDDDDDDEEDDEDDEQLDQPREDDSRVRPAPAAQQQTQPQSGAEVEPQIRREEIKATREDNPTEEESSPQPEHGRREESSQQRGQTQPLREESERPQSNSQPRPEQSQSMDANSQSRKEQPGPNSPAEQNQPMPEQSQVQPAGTTQEQQPQGAQSQPSRENSQPQPVREREPVKQVATEAPLPTDGFGKILPTDQNDEMGQSKQAVEEKKLQDMIDNYGLSDDEWDMLLDQWIEWFKKATDNGLTTSKIAERDSLVFSLSRVLHWADFVLEKSFEEGERVPRTQIPKSPSEKTGVEDLLGYFGVSAFQLLNQ